MRRSQQNKIFYSVVRSLLLLVTIMFGESLPGLGLVGSNPLPVHFLYAGKLAEPEPPKPLRGCHKTLVPMLSGLAGPSGGNELLPLPFWPMKPTRHINLLAISPEVPENTSNMLIATGAAGGDDGDKPPDGNHWSSHPEPQLDVPLALSPVKKCLQHKRQLLRMLRIKRLWATITGQTTLARILSDRIMVTEADLLDLERSDRDRMHPGLIGRWLAGHNQELSVYREIISGKYSGRQAGTRKKNQPSRIIKASTTATTGQMSGAAARKQTTGSAGDSGDGDDESLKPSAEQDTRGSVVTCTKCHKPLNQQELSRIANEAAVSAFLCNNCLAGTHGQKRARQPQKETEPDTSEPDQKKKKGSGRKRNHSKTVVAGAPAKKRNRAAPQIPDDLLKKMKESIQYELSKEELEKAQTLIEIFKKKNITVKDTFYKLLGFVDRESFNAFFDNTATFFGHLSENFKNTGMLTCMLNCTKKHILSFAKRSQCELEYLASLDILSSFSSMHNGKGVPTHEEVKAILGWPEWKDKRGEFNMKLFRAFSSMCNTKGLPKHEEVAEVLSWPEWQEEDGEFNMELFRSFSSMYNARGMLKHEHVKEVLGWPEWKDKDREFSMELFRTFSSMNHGKGVPEHEQVKEVLSWPEWKDRDGQFNMELFRAFSSINSSKGMLKHEKVKEVLGWPEWKNKDGQFNMELFRAFSSMHSSKGILKHEEVREVLNWPEWKDADREFSIQLFRAFSGMNHTKGVPKHEQVKQLLGWPEWKDKDGQFNMELFRAFSSMNNGKGLPKRKEVEEILGWPEWKDKDDEFNIERFRAFSSMNNGQGVLKHQEVKEVQGWLEWKDRDGQFNIELFRALSSMNASRGLPKHEQVKEMLGWPEWKDKDDEFSMELFRAFSSMNHTKGLLKHEEVQEVLSWSEWKDQNGEFSMERFRALSCMNSGKGMLKHKEVKTVLSWPEWKDKNGDFSMERFRAFSSMNNGRGVPKHEEVKKVIGWTGCGDAPNHQLLQIMTRLWASAGLPDVDMLQHRETQLKHWLFTEPAEERSDSEDEEGDQFNRQIKTVALYLSTSKTDWLLKWATLKRFHQCHEKIKTVLILEPLIRLLSSYGGKGIEHYLRANQKDRNFLWHHSSKGVPLQLLNKAMVLFSDNKFRARFVYFVKRLKSLPDKSLWKHYSDQLQPLSGVLKHAYMQRLYWELLQPLTKDDQLRFLDASHAQAVFDLFPSLSALYKLSKEYSSRWLIQLFEACLGLKTHEITKEGIQILFEALLKTHSFLPWDQDIPDHFLSGMHTTDNNTVEIPVSGLIPSGDQLALNYIAVLMQTLNQMSFAVKGQWLEVEVLSYRVLIYRFPVPQLKIQDEKIEISNWSKEQFRAFLKIIRMPQRYYLTADQWQRRLKPDERVHIQRLEVKLVANRESGEKAAIEAALFKPLPVYVLATLINRQMAISPTAWKSLNHHKERLPESLLSKLRERIEASGTECLDEIKESLSQYLNKVQPRGAEACEMVNVPELHSVSPPDDKREKQAFVSLWLRLNQTEVFDIEILTLLDGYRDEMELMHIVTVLKKAKIDISDHILEGWRQQACSEIKRLKSREPLLSVVDPDVYQSCQELELLDECGSIF